MCSSFRYENIISIIFIRAPKVKHNLYIALVFRCFSGPFRRNPSPPFVDARFRMPPTFLDISVENPLSNPLSCGAPYSYPQIVDNLWITCGITVYSMSFSPAVPLFYRKFICVLLFSIIHIPRFSTLRSPVFLFITSKFCPQAIFSHKYALFSVLPPHYPTHFHTFPHFYPQIHICHFLLLINMWIYYKI